VYNERVLYFLINYSLFVRGNNLTVRKLLLLVPLFTFWHKS